MSETFEARQVDLQNVAGGKLEKMPWVHRIFLENLSRHAGKDPDAARALQLWMGEGRTDIEAPFYPYRIMMHDTTCGPALADLAAMRSTLAEAGVDPRRINPVLRIDVSTDHSLAVDVNGAGDAAASNMAVEMRRNAERYRFMKWAAQRFDNLHLHPPGTGIMHTINIEQLASVIAEQQRDGERWRFPETLIGTDSHTPMVNGLGVLAWGVGGLEAESVMLGEPVMQRLPSVVGVRLTGAMPANVFATDLALAVTHLLRQHPVNGRFVEFFGPGVETLSAGDRCVVANMAPEFGGASGYFPVDDQTLAYLKATGRTAEHLRDIETYFRAQGLWGDPDAAPDYADVIELDMDTLEPALSGPHRPQDLRSLATARQHVATAKTPKQQGAPDMPVAIAAITSCTNTSDPRLLIAAGLMARKAREFGLTPPAWVKTSLAPGSPAARRYLQRAGLLDDLEAVGFAIVGFGCTTCIGNSGPLTPAMNELLQSGSVSPVAVLSGNRNFPGRVHGQVTDSFLASPPLVVAYALSGDFSIDLTSSPLGMSQNGEPVFLSDVQPSQHEIDSVLYAATCRDDYGEAFREAAASKDWAQLTAPDTDVFPWDPASAYIRRPPFADAKTTTRLGRYSAYPLLVLGDDITTDHISPAGAVPKDSDAARYLVEHGEDRDDLNVYSARRANWEVMLRGLFTNPSARNLLADDIAAGQTIHIPSGEQLPIWKAAARYERDKTPVVIVAGEKYGMGSSRDWAAKGAHLLGVRAVLANSFERIHRSNLINMGVLPLQMPKDMTPTSLALAPGDQLAINAAAEYLAPGSRVSIVVFRKMGGTTRLTAHAAVETQSEIETLQCGGLLPRILRRYM